MGKALAFAFVAIVLVVVAFIVVPVVVRSVMNLTKKDDE